MKNNIIKIVFILILCFFSNSIAEADVTIYNKNGVYAPWDQVINKGRIYECFEQFKTNQCNFWSLYEPGVGIYWRNTWRVVSAGSNSNNNIIITNDSTENTKDFPWVPFITSTPKVTQSWSYIIEWEISDSSPSWKFVKLEENWEITNKVYWENNSNIRFGSFSFSNMPNGDYKYAIYLCIQNDAIEKCSKSNIILVKVDNSYDADKVTIIKGDKTPVKEVKPSTLPEKDTIVKIYPWKKGSNIPTDYRENIEKKIQTIVLKNKLNKEEIKEIVTNIETKLFILEVKNRKWLLSWAEKRNYFLYKMIKEIFQTYLH